MPLDRIERRHALMLMVIAPLLWSTAGVVTRWLSLPMQGAAAGYELTFWRSLFAALFVVTWLLRSRGGLRQVWTSEKMGFASGLCWTVGFTCFMLALSLTTVANTLIVMCISPLLTALLAWWLLGTRLPLRSWIAIVAAGFGIAMMFAAAAGAAASGAHALGMVVALGVPVSAAVNLIMMQRSRCQVDLIPAVLIGAVISALLMLPLALPFRAGLSDVAWLAALGVFQLGLPCILLVLATRSLAAPQVALLALLEVVLGPLWAWLGAGEAPGSHTLTGAAIVVGAIVFHEITAVKARPIHARGV